MSNQEEGRMSRSEHTPGPWEFVIDGDWPMIYSAALDDEGHRIPVADLFHGGYDFADKGWPLSVNARLIAAAPELLERLEALSFEIKCFLGDAPVGTILHSAIEKADAAIDKARTKDTTHD